MVCTMVTLTDNIPKTGLAPLDGPLSEDLKCLWRRVESLILETSLKNNGVLITSILYFRKSTLCLTALLLAVWATWQCRMLKGEAIVACGGIATCSGVM